MSVDGPLVGIRVLELANEWTAFAGRTFIGLGADVVVAEPPGGHSSRAYGPFADDRPGPERSLWWCHYNIGKKGVVLDLEAEAGRDRFRRLVHTADVVLEGEPGRLERLRIDYDQLRADNPGVVWVSVTPFGRTGDRRDEPATDLTLLAGGGPVWSCGYDDHRLPPVRGGGNQSVHVGGAYAVMGALTALEHRSRTGRGQLVDVCIYAALNVTTEGATYDWLVAGATVQRQTGRHAWVSPTEPVQVQAADGRYVSTGPPQRTGTACKILLEWLDTLGLGDHLPEAFFLELGMARGDVWPATDAADVEGDEIFRTERSALMVIAQHLPAYDFFIGAQERGIAVGIVYSPEETLADPQFAARGVPVELYLRPLDRTVQVPGKPLAWGSDRAWPSPAPSIGEHDDGAL